MILNLSEKSCNIERFFFFMGIFDILIVLFYEAVERTMNDEKDVIYNFIDINNSHT